MSNEIIENQTTVNLNQMNLFLNRELDRTHELETININSIIRPLDEETNSAYH